MQQLTMVAKKLRSEHQYGGYIHLKTIPGCSDELIHEAGRWADRLSVNIELPTQNDLKQLAPEKDSTQIVTAMDTVKTRIDETKADKKQGFKAPSYAPAGQSTQLIVGATETPDAAILQTVTSLYQDQRLRRVYYSAYSPIPHADARLPGMAPPLVREHRLYQADWLLRFYGFSADELFSPQQQNLPLDIDPKLAWALANRDRFPVDINRADREMLLRIPGIGSRSVGRILQIRKHRSLSVADLKKLRVAWKRAAPFVITTDANPSLKLLDSLQLKQKTSTERQLSLFDAIDSARQLIAAEISPREVCFRENSSQAELFGATNTPQEKLPAARPFRVDRKFMQLADRVVCHRDVDRYDLLYRILWRLTHGEPKLMQVTVDDDIYRASMMEKAVRRDAHKMKAFVRFCQVETESDREKYVAWHEPDHKVLRLIAPFFARRFRGMDWTILTPDESVSWDGKQFAWGPGVPMSQRPHADSLEELWKTYYASIFNP
ncbi:unnamed protein product, partial [Symbiodinium microadriaticum]